MAIKLETLAGMGPTKEDATKDLESQLPYRLGSSNYKVFRTYEKSYKGRVLIECKYSLNSAKAQAKSDTIKKPGVGSYVTELEAHVRDRDSDL